MTFTLTFAWWWMPSVVTLTGLAAVLLQPDEGGYLGGLGHIFLLIHVLLLSCIAWAIAGALK